MGFVTALATLSSLKCEGKRNCKLNACFSILIFVIEAASLVFMRSRHVSISAFHVDGKHKEDAFQWASVRDEIEEKKGWKICMFVNFPDVVLLG